MDQCCIIIPSHNRPGCIPKSTRSALVALANAASSNAGSTSPDHNVIVVDDGDTHPAKEALSDLSDTRLTIVENTGNRGAGNARNFGAARSDSGLLFFLDDDDLLAPDYVRRILAHRRSGNCDAVWGFSKVRNSRLYRGLPTAPAQLAEETPLLQRLSGLGTGFWIERAVFQRLDGIDGTLSVNEDTDLCLKLATQGLLPWFEPESGVSLDAARSQQTDDAPSVTQSSRAASRAAAWETILSRHHEILSRNPEAQSEFIGRVAKFRARSGDWKGALSLAWRQPLPKRFKTLLRAISGVL